MVGNGGGLGGSPGSWAVVQAAVLAAVRVLPTAGVATTVVA
jgi:hypothetical protein